MEINWVAWVLANQISFVTFFLNLVLIALTLALKNLCIQKIIIIFYCYLETLLSVSFFLFKFYFYLGLSIYLLNLFMSRKT